MILIDKKLIFVHIPKAGGTSIEHFLIKYFGKKERSTYYFVDGVGKRLSNKNDGSFTLYPIMHYTLPWIEEELKKIDIIVDDTWNIFSIVRNPYYKMISELFFNERSPLIYHYHTIPEVSKHLYINQVLDDFLEKDTWNNYNSLHSLPQYAFFAGTKLQKVHICKFEDGLENIMNTLGLETEGQFPHKLNHFAEHNVPRPNYKDVLTKHFVEVINEKYKLDFEKFGYEMLEPLDFPG